MKRPKLTPTLLRQGLLVLGCVAILAVLQGGRLRQLTTTETEVSPAQAAANSAAQALNLDVLKAMPTLGFDNLVADWGFLQYLQYFGNRAERRLVGYQLAPEFFELIVTTNPRFTDTYPFLSFSTSVYAARPERSVELLAQGLAAMTPTTPADSFFVWRHKGIDELLFLGDGAAARQSYATAAEWAAQSDHPEAEVIGEGSAQTAEFLASNPNSRAAQISAWAQVLARARDDETRQLAITQIEALGGEIVVSEGGRATVRYRPDTPPPIRSR